MSQLIIAAPAAFLFGLILGLGLCSRYRLVRRRMQEPPEEPVEPVDLTHRRQ